MSHVAVLALHWQVNVVSPEGFFAGLLAEPVAASGVIGRAAAFHDAAREAGARLVWTRFTVPEGEGQLVRNTGFMTAVGEHQGAFRPDAPGAALVAEAVHSPLPRSLGPSVDRPAEAISPMRPLAWSLSTPSTVTE